jgi:hypothetical protein
VARVAGLLAIAVFGVVAAAAFDRALDRRLDEAAVSASTLRLLEPERGKLGAMKPPAQATPSETRTIEGAVGSALESSFRLVCWICGGLALAAAVCAAWGVKKTASFATT